MAYKSTVAAKILGDSATTFASKLCSFHEPRVCPRGPVGTILGSPGFSATLVGGSWGAFVSAPPDSYRGVLLPRWWIFALAFGGVSKYTSTLTLVEGENRCEGL